MPRNKNRDDFTAATKEKLAKRVNFICSNQDCRRGTIAAATNSEETINTGVAAHICAASPGGPRYDVNMTSEERSSINNGIWLCQTCSTLIDRDVKKYTVEKLQQWKIAAEDRAKEGLVKPMYELTELDKKLMEIIPDESTGINWESSEAEDSYYSELYKEYIKRFDPLKDYLYCINIGNFFNKEYNDFNDNVNLVFGKNILEWLIGKKEFPIDDLKKFYNVLMKEYKLDNSSLIKKRWEAMTSYFTNNVENAQKIYFELYDIVKESNNIPNWFKDDIYIDGRNINNLLDNIAGKFCLNNIFQQQINLNNHKLSYPGIDRIKCDIYEDSIEKVVDYKNKYSNTILYGIGLENTLNLVQESVYISIIYGSITQLRLVRSVFSNVMGLYSECFKEEKFYRLTLKLKVLSGQYDDYKKICNNIKYDYKFVNSKQFIEEIIELQNSVLYFDINNFYCFIFDVYGRNINDEAFMFIENKMYEIIDDKKDINPSIISKVLKTIPNNINRLSKKILLFKILSNYVKKDFSRFYIHFSDILNNIKLDNLSKKETKEFIGLVDMCYNLDNIDVADAIIEIKKKTKTTKYDQHLLASRARNRILNKFNDNDNLGAIKDIIHEISFCVEQREEQPGVHIGYDVHYGIDKFFIKKNYDDETRTMVINYIFPLAKKILLSKKQYASEKIHMLKVLSNILTIDSSSDIENECKILINNIVLKSADNPFGISKTETDIDINLLLIKYFVGQINLHSLLNQYLIYAVEDDNNLEEILKCIIQLRHKKKLSNTNIESIYIIYNLAINKRKIEVTKYAIELSSLFINTRFYEVLESDLEEIISYNNYNELIFIVEMIRKLTKPKKKKVEKIITILENNENYNLKYVINKYLK